MRMMKSPGCGDVARFFCRVADQKPVVTPSVTPEGVSGPNRS